jgi:ParB family chromosome partitioning protein
MALKRSEKKGEPKGREHLGDAPIGTETQIPCEECGVRLAVAEGTGKLAGMRVLKCQRLGCRHQEALPAAAAMAASGSAGLPGLDVGDVLGEDDAVATKADQAAAGPTPASASAGVSGDRGSVRNDPRRRRGETVAEHERRLLNRAQEGATVAEDPSFGAPEVAQGERAEGDVVRTLAVDDPAGGAPIEVRVYGGPVMPVEVLDAVGRVAEAAAAQFGVADLLAPSLIGKPVPIGETLATVLAHYVQPQGEAPDVRMIPIEDIAPHPLNPRKRFDEESLAELAASIREEGLLQPITVRSAGDVPPSVPRWWIVAGERRWRACQMAGLAHIAAIVREVDDAAHLRLALLENLARKDLDPIEEARGYRQLVDVVGMKQAQIADAVGRAPSSVANALRLLDLPADVLDLIQAGKLSQSHGKALLRFKPWPKLMSKIAELAAAQGTASRLLEAGLPFAKELPAGLARAIPSWTQDFDTNTCKACPFGAMVNDGYYNYCIKPPHMAQLKREAKEAREAQKEQLKAGPSPTVDGGDAAGAPKLITLADLRHGEYEQVCRPGGKGGRAEPPGCSASCPCAAVVNCGRHPSGQESECGGVTVCLDPKRFRELQQAEATRQEGLWLAAQRRALALVDAAAAEASATDSKALALLVIQVLSATEYSDREMVKALVGQWVPSAQRVLGDPTDWRYRQIPVPLLQALERAPAEALLRLAVAVGSTKAVVSHFQTYGTGSDLARWWLPSAAALRPGEAGAAVSATREMELRGEALRAILGEDVGTTGYDALTFPIEAQQPCANCGGVVLVNSADELRQLAEDLAEGAASDVDVNVFCDPCAPGRGDLPEREATPEEQEARAEALADRVAGRAVSLAGSLSRGLVGAAAGE